MKPKVALVGRPNVGKSALFNRITRSRLSIVDEAEGITRDRLYGSSDLFGLPFDVIDTGGIHPRSKALFNDEIKRQAEIAIEEADSLIMVVDSQIGVTDLDEELARYLLRHDKPLCLAVNKIDTEDHEPNVAPFHTLGIEHVYGVSAHHDRQIAELLEAALSTFEKDETETELGGIKVAIVGKPNVGKSSLTNALLNEQRCVVSPLPGTTRDSIDVTISHQDKVYSFIDTAGIRRKHSEHEVVDKFAAIRTEKAIERADICLLMIDATEGLTSQDKKIANLIEGKGRGCILLINKWDLVKNIQMEHFLKDIRKDTPFLEYCPKLFTSVEQDRNLEKIFPHIEEVYQHFTSRIPTAELNRLVEKAVQLTPPPMIQGKRFRIFYLAQVSSSPPKFTFFVNYPKLLNGAYRRYLYNQLRKAYPFTGVPLQFFFRKRSSK